MSNLKACGSREMAAHLPHAFYVNASDSAAKWIKNLCDPNIHNCAEAGLIITAHPDDEVIGAGSRLPRLTNAVFLHTTDGAPRDLKDARSSGFTSRKSYAAARREEFRSAIKLLGGKPRQAFTLNYIDQEASLHLAALTRDILSTLIRVQPHAILTHPYEGGHPDHDATAFAVQNACALMSKTHRPVPFRIEMAFYFERDGAMTSSKFPHESGVSRVQLSKEEKQFKQSLLDCYVSQAAMIANFPPEIECFRPAPTYDFKKPPHEGVLFYERFGWGMKPSRWRTLACEALEILGL